MPYIGKNPVGGGFHKLDALTASATATYALTLNSAAYFPESANQLLVSLNGVIQAPQDSFTVSGSNLVFDTALTTSDSIDFVVALGDVLAVQTVTDGAITTAKLGNGAVTSAKLDTNIDIAGTLDVSGVLTADSGIKLSTGTDALTTYEVGTWTPSDASGAGLTLTVNSANYVRVGNAVHLQAYFVFPSTSNTSVLTVGGLPFTSIGYSTMPLNSAIAGAHVIQIQPSNTEFIVKNQTNANFTNNQFSGAFIVFSGTYLTS